MKLPPSPLHPDARPPGVSGAVTATALALVAMLAPTSGCQGTISDKGAGPSTGDTTPGGGGTGALCTAGQAPPPIGARVRRLTNAEFLNTLTDLLGATYGALASGLEADSRASGYSTGEERTVTSGYADSLNRLAQSAATTFHSNIATDGAAYGVTASCVSSDATARTCATNFARNFGARAFRRPLGDDEVTALLAVYDAGRDTGTDGNASDRMGAGLEYTVRAVLQSPEMVYRTELGAATAAPGSNANLTPAELASALSYSLLASPPDAELTRAATAGELGSANGMAGQARRLISAYPDRFRSQLREFVIEWLGINIGKPEWNKDVSFYPMFNDAMKQAFQKEAELYIDDWTDGGSLLPGLFTSSSSFVSSANAPLYGMTAGGTGFAKVSLNPAQRAGILTLPAFLGSYAKTDSSSPVMRGVAVLRRLFCQEPPPVPAVVPPLPPPDKSMPKTTRARYAAHETADACKNCHSGIDPFGLVFENYDAIGGFRTQENGVDVDATGAIVGTPHSDQPLDGAVQMADALAASQDVQACVAAQVYRFTFGRKESGACAVQGYATTFAAQELDMRELLVSIVTSPAFNQRAIPRP